MTRFVIHVKPGSSLRLDGTPQWTTFASDGQFVIETTEPERKDTMPTTPNLDTVAGITDEITRLQEKVRKRNEKSNENRARIRELVERRETLRYPPEPTVDAIGFVKVFRGNPIRYRYVAHKDDDRGLWWASGATGPNGVTWRQLVDFMRRDNVAPGIYSALERGVDRSYSTGHR